MMKICVAGVAKGHDQEFSFETEVGELDIPEDVCEFDGKISVEGTVCTTGESYRAQGTIRCKKIFLCDRCLKPSAVEQIHEFSEDYCTVAERAERESVNYTDGSTIDITELVRDTLMAAQPLSNLCKPDCRGLCPVCGTDLNEGTCDCDASTVDPRLAVLQQFKKQV